MVGTEHKKVGGGGLTQSHHFLIFLLFDSESFNKLTDYKKSDLNLINMHNQRILGFRKEARRISWSTDPLPECRGGGGRFCDPALTIQNYHLPKRNNKSYKLK